MLQIKNKQCFKFKLFCLATLSNSRFLYKTSFYGKKHHSHTQQTCSDQNRCVTLHKVYFLLFHILLLINQNKI